MLKLQRPDKRPDFDKTVATAKSNVADDIKAGKKPVFPGLWSEFKFAFNDAQHGKCGFCEGQVRGLQHGDVEHFRPKAEIHELDDDPDYWGKECTWKSSVENRRCKTPVIAPGYWWNAYDWENYLLSCQICNQQWKANLFPVVGQRAATPNSGPENVLLLSPFDDFDPVDHFEYGRLGEIRGLTAQGHATVVTCGLDRPSLRLARYKTARAVHEYIDEIAGHLTAREMRRMLGYIERDGQEAQPFAGMVRTIFEQRTALKWEQLPKLIEKLDGMKAPDRHMCEREPIVVPY